MLAKFKTFSFWVLPILLLLGIILRVVVYLQNRSLTLDEANLARNIVEKSGSAFFQSLDYQQYCPPVFLLLTKWSSVFFGVEEWSLKLLPFLGGVLLLLLFGLLLKKIVEVPVVQWYLLLVLSFSHLAIRYSTELKQYSLDAFLALFLLFGALHFRKVEWTIRKTLTWLLLGSMMIWTSMPSIFLLAAIGIAFLYQAWSNTQKVPIGLIIIGVFWVLNFGVYFWMVLYQDASSEALQDYHQHFFFEFLASSKEAWGNNYELVKILLTSITDHTVLGGIFGGLFIILGAIYIIKKDKFKALLLLLPIACTLLASNWGLYSLIPRLTLFLIPIFLLLMGVGLSTAWKKMTKFSKGIVIIIMLISIINKEGYQYFWTKMEFENSKAVLAYLKEHRSQEELIFVQQGAVPAFIFYNTMHEQAYHFQQVYLANWNDDPAQIIPKQDEKGTAFWLFFSHTSSASKAAYLAASNQIAVAKPLYFEAVEASTYAFERK